MENITEGIIEIICAFIGSLGFSILFKIRGWKLVFISFGGAMSWAIYLVVNFQLNNAVFSLFAASIAVSILAELLARVIKAPVILLLTPMLVPLIPGGDLFYTMSYLVYNDMEKFTSYFQLVIKEAAAIAVGMILVYTMVQVIMNIKSAIRMKRL